MDNHSAGSAEGPVLSKVEGPAPRLLLVEDNEDVRWLVERYLSKTGHHIDTAENGQVAVEKFLSGKYDLILMDMNMPILDGYAATQNIRKWESERKSGPPVPIIALTASTMKEEIQRSLEAGCNSHLTKPFKREALMTALSQYLKMA